MSLETATFIPSLDSSNPVSSDLRSQGDDHLRLIKAVLKATFPTSSKAWYNPTSSSKTADWSVVSTDMNKTFLVDTTSASVTATLPTLVSGDAGWECSFIKTNTGTNPLFIAPPSGTIQSGEVSGLAKTRRCIPGHRTKVIWTGSAWIAERIVQLPVGAIVDCPLSGLPVGYEWANGQTLSSSANYPDYNSANGGLVVPDRRGRVAAGRDDMGGSAASRLVTANGGVDGATLGAAGGNDKTTLIRTDLPDHTLAIASGQGSHTHTLGSQNTAGQSVGQAQSGVGTGVPLNNGTIVITAATLPAMVTESLNGGVTQTFPQNTQPTIVTNQIVVVE